MSSYFKHGNYQDSFWLIPEIHLSPGDIVYLSKGIIYLVLELDNSARIIKLYNILDDHYHERRTENFIILCVKIWHPEENVLSLLAEPNESLGR